MSYPQRFPAQPSVPSMNEGEQLYVNMQMVQIVPTYPRDRDGYFISQGWVTNQPPVSQQTPVPGKRKRRQFTNNNDNAEDHASDQKRQRQSPCVSPLSYQGVASHVTPVSGSAPTVGPFQLYPATTISQAPFQSPDLRPEPSSTNQALTSSPGGGLTNDTRALKDIFGTEQFSPSDDDQDIVDGMDLAEICRRYPNHLQGRVLQRFVNAGWSAKDVQKHITPRANLERLVKSGKTEILQPWSVFQQRMSKLDPVRLQHTQRVEKARKNGDRSKMGSKGTRVKTTRIQGMKFAGHVGPLRRSELKAQLEKDGVQVDVPTPSSAASTAKSQAQTPFGTNTSPSPAAAHSTAVTTPADADLENPSSHIQPAPFAQHIQYGPFIAPSYQVDMTQANFASQSETFQGAFAENNRYLVNPHVWSWELTSPTTYDDGTVGEDWQGQTTPWDTVDTNSPAMYNTTAEAGLAGDQLANGFETNAAVEDLYTETEAVDVVTPVLRDIEGNVRRALEHLRHAMSMKALQFYPAAHDRAVQEGVEIQMSKYLTEWRDSCPFRVSQGMPMADDLLIDDLLNGIFGALETEVFAELVELGITQTVIDEEVCRRMCKHLEELTRSYV